MGAIKSILLRDYTLATFNTIQPLIDSSEKLQGLFGDSDPEVIANKLMEGIKEIMDIVVKKKRVQERKKKYEYWCTKLEEERKKVASLHKVSIATKDTEDIRNHKNAKNIHTQN